MGEFRRDTSRDAGAAVAGYYYQILTTILRWLELQSGSVLEIECGEDIDQVKLGLEGQDQSRILEQV